MITPDKSRTIGWNLRRYWATCSCIAAGGIFLLSFAIMRFWSCGGSLKDEMTFTLWDAYLAFGLVILFLLIWHCVRWRPAGAYYADLRASGAHFYDWPKRIPWGRFYSAKAVDKNTVELTIRGPDEPDFDFIRRRLKRIGIGGDAFDPDLLDISTRYADASATEIAKQLELFITTQSVDGKLDG